jgi:hypothetical protein
VHELGVQKVGQNMNQVVSGKGDLTGKLTMFGGFFQIVPQKFESFSVDLKTTLLPN